MSDDVTPEELSEQTELYKAACTLRPESRFVSAQYVREDDLYLLHIDEDRYQFTGTQMSANDWAATVEKAIALV